MAPKLEGLNICHDTEQASPPEPQFRLVKIERGIYVFVGKSVC